MAITQVGTVLELFPNSAADSGTVSSTITVPSDAELIVVGVVGFEPTANYFSGGDLTFTKGGSDTTMSKGSNLGDGNTGLFMAALFYLVLPDTGTNKSLKWNWLGAGGPSNNPGFSITFWKGVNTSDLVRSTSGAQAAAPSYVTGTLTAVTGDKIIAWTGYFASVEGSTTWANATELAEIARFASDGDGSWATADPTGNQTVSVTAAGGSDDGGIIAIVVKAAPVITQVSFRGFEDGDELPHMDPGTLPAITSATGTTDSVDGTTVTASYPATVTAGDLIIWVVAKHDDVTAIVDTTGGLTPLAEGNGGSGTAGVRLGVWYEIADGTEDGTTRVFTADSEMFQVWALRILAGAFDPANPIGAVAALTGATSGTTANTGAFVSPRAGSLVIACGAVEIDPMDATFSPAGWTDVADADAGDVTGWVSTRDAATTLGETVAAASFGINADDAWCAVALTVNAPLVPDGRAAIAAVNTNFSRDPADPFGISIRIYNSGGPTAEDTYKLQYRLNAGTWTDITGSSSVIRTVTTADFADGADVPEFLGGSGTYITNNNAALETDGELVLAAVLGATEAFELHVQLEIQSSDVADDDEIELRVVEQDGTTLDAYTTTALITVTNAGGGAIAVTGALAAQSAIIAGVAEPIISVDGALAAQSAVIAGVTEPIISADGTLVSQSSIIAGVAEVIVDAAGVLASQSSVIAGVVEPVISVDGALSAQSAVIEGIVEPAISADGALASQAASIEGIAEAIISVNGALAAQSASISGVLEALISVNGTLQASSAIIEGTYTAESNVISATGDLLAQPASISGAIEAIASFNGILAAQAAFTAGDATVITPLAFIGTLASQSASISGTFTTIPLLQRRQKSGMEVSRHFTGPHAWNFKVGRRG